MLLELHSENVNNDEKSESESEIKKNVDSLTPHTHESDSDDGDYERPIKSTTKPNDCQNIEKIACRRVLAAHK